MHADFGLRTNVFPVARFYRALLLDKERITIYVHQRSARAGMQGHTGDRYPARLPGACRNVARVMKIFSVRPLLSPYLSLPLCLFTQRHSSMRHTAAVCRWRSLAISGVSQPFAFSHPASPRHRKRPAKQPDLLGDLETLTSRAGLELKDGGCLSGEDGCCGGCLDGGCGA